MGAGDGAGRPILLDCDGVLLDVSERYYRVHRVLERLLKRCDPLGEPTPSTLDPATFWDMKRRRRPIREILEASDIGVEFEPDYRSGWLDRIEATEFSRHDRLLPGAREHLEVLATHYPLILVSLRQRPQAVLERLEELGLRPYFQDVLVGSPRDGEGWQVKAGLIRQKLVARRAILIAGDTEVDIRAGKALGIGTVGVLSGIRDRAALEEEGPDHLVDDLGGLAAILGIDRRAEGPPPSPPTGT